MKVKNNRVVRTDKEYKEILDSGQFPSMDISDMKWIDENLPVENKSEETQLLNELDEFDNTFFQNQTEEGGEINSMPQVIDDYGSYEIPKGDSAFLKLVDAETRIRLCSKPMEVKLHEIAGAKFSTALCQGEGCGLCAKNVKIKYKYAYIVLSRVDNKAYVYEAPITVFRQIASYAQNKEYGDPQMYDITIKKECEKPQIVYTILPSPKQTKLTKEEIEILEQSKISLVEVYAQKAKG